MVLWSLVLDVVVAALLIATIVYAGRLNARLGLLREDRDRLKELIAGLQLSTRQAEDAVRDLKLGAAESGHELQQTIERSTSLKADLAYLVERGETAANRIEAGLKMQRDAREPQPAAARPARPAAAARTAAAPDEPPESHRLSSLLRQAALPEPEAKAEPPASADAPKSRSERELLRALEARR